MCKSRTAIVGNPFRKRVHFAPPFVVKNNPYSVPTKIKSLSTGSSAIASTGPPSGKSPTIDVHVLPKSVVFSKYGLKSSDLCPSNAAYTVFTSCDEATTRVTYVMSGTPGNVSIFRQCAPPSSVTLINPSSVPTYSRFSFFGDSESVVELPKNEVEAFLATASGPQTLPITGSELRSICRV